MRRVRDAYDSRGGPEPLHRAEALDPRKAGVAQKLREGALADAIRRKVTMHYLGCAAGAAGAAGDAAAAGASSPSSQSSQPASSAAAAAGLCRAIAAAGRVPGAGRGRQPAGRHAAGGASTQGQRHRRGAPIATAAHRRRSTSREITNYDSWKMRQERRKRRRRSGGNCSRTPRRGKKYKLATMMMINRRAMRKRGRERVGGIKRARTRRRTVE